MNAQHKPPHSLSVEILASPARGDLHPFREGYWHEEDGKSEWRDVPYRAGCAARVGDVFDVMTDQTLRRGAEPVFKAGDVSAGREYRALVEWVSSSGIKCSSAFDIEVRGTGKVDAMDAYALQVERLRAFHIAIGEQIAKDTKRGLHQSSAGRVRVTDTDLARSGRRIITVRALVDQVCLREATISDVLRSHGWTSTGKNHAILRDALVEALGRMRGI